jgi:eukaryotic-like serine/threonine-protein kinase
MQPTLSTGDQLGNRYRIEAILGEGGMGMVYRARDLELSRTVALKIIRPELASRPEILDRFKREILLASQVTHRNVVRIYDLGEAGDLRFISMSYIEGESLRALLDREGPLTPDRGVPLIRTIALALQAAHEAGIVHRDLKPHNVLIDREGQPYIGDFGISRSMDSDGTMTETGAILGTVDYMSPEQARGDVPDHRSDIYSLGMMMFEMFTGTLPFRAANPLSVMVRRVHEDAPAPTQVRPGMPPWLSAIIMRAMQRDATLRYQSVADLLKDLDRQRATRARRKLLTRRAVLVAAIVVAVAVALAVAVPLGRRFMASGPQAAPAVKTSLAVMPFRNATGDPKFDWVRSGVTSVVRTGLIQAKALRLAGDDRVQEILDLLKPAEGEESRPATVQRLGRLAGVDNVLAGSLVRLGGQFRFDAQIMRIGESGVTGATPVVVDGKDEAAILAMMDDLTRKVRDELGVGRSWGEREISAAQLSTASVEALSAYGEGLALQRAGNDIEATKRLEAAVAADPGFAVARSALAESYDALGHSDKAKKAADEAIAAARDVSPWEAARIRATRARLAGNLDEAEKALQTIVEAAPNDTASLLDLGLVQEERGELAGALKTLERAAALDPRHPGAQYALGRILFKSGRPADAVAGFNRALALHGEAGNDEARATVLNGLGVVHQGLNQFDEAERYFKDSLEIRRRIGDTRGVAVCLNNLALVNRTRGRYDEAVRVAREALDVSTAMGDRERIAESWTSLGETYQDAGRPEEALAAYQESLKAMREAGDEEDLGQNLRNLGYVNAILGKYVEAFFFMKEALAKTREAGDKSSLMRALGDIANVEQLQGRYEEALAYHVEALGLAREVDDKGAAAATQSNMAQIHEDQGDYGAALGLFAEAEAVLRPLGGDATLADCLAFMGGARRRLGDLAGAGATLSEAIRLARELHSDATLAEALVYEGERLTDLQESDKATVVLHEAIQIARRVGDFRLIRMARLADGRRARSAQQITSALAEIEKAGLAPLIAPALLDLARIDLASGRAPAARDRAVKAAAAAARLHQRDLIFQAARIEGAALAKAGQGPAALEAFRKGLGPLEEMRSGLKGEALKAFLARPETAAFARDAAAAFRAASAPEQERLAKLLQP